MNRRGIGEDTSTRQMSQEELLKTQVLNLQDVEEAVKNEKRTSKKPAIVVACLGIIAVLFGGMIYIVQPIIFQRNNQSEKTTKKVEKKKVLNTTSTLNCTYTSLSNPDGTDTILNVNLAFTYDKLIKITKTYTINPTVGNPIGTTTIEQYYNGYQPFLVDQIPGYRMTVSKASNGLIITSIADLTTLDITSLPELHQGNIATKVEYQANTEKQTIQANLTGRGYTCN